MGENTFAVLLKRAIYASSGSLVSRVAASLAGIILARVIGPGMFGIYSAVLALIDLSGAFTEIGMVTELKRQGSRSPALISVLLGNALLVQLLLCLISLAGAFLALPLFSENPLAKALFPPIALMSVCALLAEPFLAVLQLRGEQRLTSLFVGGRGIAFLGSMIVLAYLRVGITFLVWFHAVCYLVFTLLIALSVLRRVGLKWCPADLPAQVRGAIPFALAGVVNTGFGNIPLLLLSHFCPAETVGNFAVASRFVMIAILAGGIANNQAFIPALFGLYQDNRKRYAQVCSSMQRLFVPLGLFASSAIYVCAEALVIVIQGEQYRGAVGILKILCWSVALTYARNAADAALTTGERMKEKILLLLISTVWILVSSLLLIRQYDATGAGIAKLSGDLLLLVSMAACVYARKLYPFPRLGLIALPAAITFSAAFLFAQSLSGRYFLSPLLFIPLSLLIWYLFLRPHLDPRSSVWNIHRSLC